jgi:glycosyltransferase involved in cell wall biosynthesis
LIFCQHFTPAFKGGGPIQSLQNLIELLHEDFKIYVFCSAKDLGDRRPMEGVIINRWIDFSPNVKVLYANSSIYSLVKSSLKDLAADVVYINGIFSFPFNLIPLFLSVSRRFQIVLAPHGMLQKGALSVKPFKKRIFICVFKLLGFYKNVRWHATNCQESDDIIKAFRDDLSIYITAAVPKLVASAPSLRRKTVGNLRLIFLSIISEKKNLHLALSALSRLSTPIEFHIYGPIKDEGYWRECKKLMNSSRHQIQYNGVVHPKNVLHLLSTYHLFILPTKGENFCHAIYESLSVGTPVLVSPHTPWGNLQDYNAGITVNTFKPEDWAVAICDFADLEQGEYAVYSKSAHKLATDYFQKNDFADQYKKLFSEKT